MHDKTIIDTAKSIIYGIHDKTIIDDTYNKTKLDHIEEIYSFSVQMTIVQFAGRMEWCWEVRRLEQAHCKDSVEIFRGDNSSAITLLAIAKNSSKRLKNRWVYTSGMASTFGEQPQSFNFQGHKGPVKLIEWVKTALLFLHVTSKRFETCLGNSRSSVKEFFKTIYWRPVNTIRF